MDIEERPLLWLSTTDDNSRRFVDLLKQEGQEHCVTISTLVICTVDTMPGSGLVSRCTMLASNFHSEHDRLSFMQIW